MSKIKILMSTYNGEKYINEQLESIFKQTTSKDISLIIRDDGSKDRTIEIINSWKDRLDIQIFQDENLGPAKSFWKLIEIAGDADFYAFCDQDDYWKADKLERATNLIGYSSEPTLYFSNAEFVDEKTNTVGELLFNKPLNVNLYRIMAVNCALGCTIVFNRAARNEFVASDLNSIEMHDKSAIAITYILGKVVYDNRPNILYRQHSNNVLGRKNKSIIKRLTQSYKLWFGKKNLSVDTQAKELIDSYGNRMSKKDLECLKLFATYKHSFNSRMRLLFCEKLKMERIKLSFTFKLRLILGVA